jgi:hypothetical protein
MDNHPFVHTIISVWCIHLSDSSTGEFMGQTLHPLVHLGFYPTNMRDAFSILVASWSRNQRSISYAFQNADSNNSSGVLAIHHSAQTLCLMIYTSVIC